MCTRFIAMATSLSLSALCSAQPNAHTSMTYSDGMLNANISSQPIARIIGDLAEKTGVRVVLNGQGPQDPVSIQLQRVPLQDAIKEILRGRNYTLVYKYDHGQRQLAEIRLNVSGGDSRTGPLQEPSAPMAVETHKSQADELAQMTEQALHDADPELRNRALIRLAERAPESSVAAAVAITLQDQDAKVRRQSLELIQRGTPVDNSVLSRLSKGEPDAALRSMVWQELIDRAEDDKALTAYLEEAKQDGDEGIKAWASRKLQELADDTASDGSDADES